MSTATALDRLRARRWGVFNHFLDVERGARDLHDIGAVLTIDIFVGEDGSWDPAQKALLKEAMN